MTELNQKLTKSMPRCRRCSPRGVYFTRGKKYLCNKLRVKEGAEHALEGGISSGPCGMHMTISMQTILIEDGPVQRRAKLGKSRSDLEKPKSLSSSTLISYIAQYVVSLYHIQHFTSHFGKSAQICSMIFHVIMQPNSQAQQQRECSLSWKRSAPHLAAAEQMHSQLLQRNAQHCKKQDT